MTVNKKKHSMTLEQPFKCTHCGASFSKERTLVSHMCEKKRRVLQKDEKRVQAGFLAFNRFYQLTQGLKKQKSYEDFCKSPLYNAFVKFGSVLNNTNPIHPEMFIDHLIKSGVKIDHWCREDEYTKFLVGVLKTEPVDSAIQRSISTMMDWADEVGDQYENYFISASPNRVVHHITSGKVSSWVLLNSSSGKKILNNLSDEQLDLIGPYIDVKFWVKKFKENPDDVALVKEVCNGAGIK